jgi:hypothetical protein
MVPTSMFGAREFMAKNSADTARDSKSSKHWYQWMCWGRLGYNPAYWATSVLPHVIQHPVPGGKCTGDV